MRRKVLKDYANTSCAIFLGWKLHVGGLDRLVEAGSGVLKIDLKTGAATLNGVKLDPPLAVGLEIRDWMAERALGDRIDLEQIEQADLEVNFAPTEQMMTRGDLRLLDLACVCSIRTDETEYVARANGREWWHRSETALLGEPNALEVPGVRGLASEQTPSEGVSVEYRLEQEELKPVLRWQVLHNRTNYTRIVVPGVIFLLVGVALVPLAQLRAQGVTCVVCGALFVTWFASLMVFTPASAWRKAKGLHQGLRVTVGEAGLSIRTEHSTTRHDWETYSDLIDRRGMLMLKLRARKAFVYVPKRAFASLHEEQEFQDVVSRFVAVRSPRRFVF